MLGNACCFGTKTFVYMRFINIIVHSGQNGVKTNFPQRRFLKKLRAISGSSIIFPIKVYVLGSREKKTYRSIELERKISVAHIFSDIAL